MHLRNQNQKKMNKTFKYFQTNSHLNTERYGAVGWWPFDVKAASLDDVTVG